MPRLIFLLMATFSLASAGRVAYAADKKCQIGRVLELPITMNSLRPTVTVKINGRDATFLLDSGAFFSMMSSATAAQYGLKLEPTPFGFRVMGVGGSTAADIATVKEFSIAGVTLKNLQFLVGGSEVNADGLLGQNFLEKFDVEYDFAKGFIRLFHTERCDNTLLAYWLKPGDAYSTMHIDPIEPRQPQAVGEGYVNGQRLRVAFDTGAFNSMLSARAAARAGVKPDSPGVVEAGYAGGLGRRQVKTYIARFASFKIGDSEEIKNAQLRFADFDLEFADMLLGADFFVSHHVFVANREHRLFLSYNGGPVFNLSKNSSAANGGAGARAEPSAAPDAQAQEQLETPAPAQAAAPSAAAAADASALARRGAASAARRDFAAGLADLTKAIELAPDEPEYYFERANAYWGNGRADLALADFDHVIDLKTDFLPAYLSRAELLLRKGDKAAAITDLTTLDRLAAPQADLRFTLADLYGRVQEYSLVIAQYDLWIKNHPDDSRMVSALGGRCLASALQNQDLGGGLKECDRAIHLADRHNPDNAHLYVNRGMLLLRQGAYKKALEDFDADLKFQPRNARALYGRGVAEARLDKPADSGRDLAAAEALTPRIADYFGAVGIVP